KTVDEIEKECDQDNDDDVGEHDQPFLSAMLSSVLATSSHWSSASSSVSYNSFHLITCKGSVVPPKMPPTPARETPSRASSSCFTFPLCWTTILVFLTCLTASSIASPARMRIFVIRVAGSRTSVIRNISARRAVPSI